MGQFMYRERAVSLNPATCPFSRPLPHTPVPMTMDAVMRRWEKDYNPRRYSRPWIARALDWAVGMALNLEWRRFQGGSGEPGLLEVHAGSG